MNATYNQHASTDPQGAPAAWILDMVSDRLGELASLGLDGTPARTLLSTTSLVWARVIGRAGVWNRRRDETRFAAAFDTLEEGTHWPSPRQFLDAIPGHNSVPEEPHRDTLPRTLAVKRLADLCSGLGLVAAPPTGSRPS
ncbi:MAG TPA: hypothetical protein VFQ88_14105 [Nevskiaceae bacterium]|nr:hypothetical protein [Nevskiaceae bacterium]